MKLWWWFIIIPVILLAGFLVLVFVVTDRDSASTSALALSDSLLTRLSTDEKLTQKELEKTKITLAKIKPAKPYIVIDTHANILSLRIEDSVLFKGTCSTGSGGELVDSLTNRRWSFATPGVFSRSPAK